MKKISEILYNKPFFLFLCFLIIAYLPVLLPFFHLKNDILTQNLPTRFVFSESIYSGFEPFWNPYLHFGIPQYGDMNNGFWNPVQWIIGATTGYNIYSITIENIFYILIGGWGIYKVCREFLSKDIAIITGLAYMTCGYVTGHMQYLCWLTGVGYFPYVLLFFLRINKNPIVKNFILGGISVFLFSASSHPGLIIGAGYFFLFLIIVIFLNRKDFLREYYNKYFWLINLLFIFISCLLSVVVIFSNLDVIRFISRGSKVSLDQTLLYPTTLQSYISLLFPLPVHKSDYFNTDIGMRNVFIGVFHFMGIFLAFRYFSIRQIISVILPVLFFILLSAGGYFKIFAWKALPLLGYVRLNGEFTYFVILLLLLCGAGGLSYLANQKDWQIRARKMFSLLALTTLVTTFLSVLIILTSGGTEIYISGNNAKEIIKNIIDTIGFWDLMIFQSILQAITLYALRQKITKRTSVALVFILNLVIITWLTMPFTGLGMMSQKEVQKVINTFPRGIQNQELVSINNSKYISSEYENQFFLIGSYSKKIGYIKPDQYPVQLNSNEEFIADTSLYNFIKTQTYIFVSTDTIKNTNTSFDSSIIKVVRSGAGYTRCIISNPGEFKWLTLLQNNYPYWQVKVNGKPVSHFTAFKTFLSVPIEKGRSDVEFMFNTKTIYLFLSVNTILFIFAIIILFIPAIANRKLIK